MHALLVAAATAASVALPGCESKCGHVHVPYPFGTTAGCYRPGFKVSSRRSAGGNDRHRHARPPKLLLGSRSDGPQVLEISVPNGTVRVSSTVWFFDVGDARTARLDVVPHDGGPFVLSAARNRLVHIGCGFRVASWAAAPSSQRAGGGGARAHSACSSSCSAEHLERQRTSRRRCDGLGLGCCDAPVPAGGLTSFAVRFEWNGTGGGGSSGSPWIASEASVAAVEQEWWSRKDNLFTLKMSLLALGRASEVVVPVVLDWAFDNSSTCAEAAARPDFGCASKHSECLNSTGSAYGYVCRCRHGYEGNPYVKDGCRRTIFAMGLGIGIFLLLLVLANVFATKSLKDHKAKKMKERFFKQNRGLLLQQLVDKDIAERMIFSLEELEKATSKFDKARILGGGGHGMVDSPLSFPWQERLRIAFEVASSLASSLRGFNLNCP
ncbi:wall-associated receptor kinase-like 17 [Panicum hallii]|uniref:wall-associated receptor kinase-like 17 n=1 Tax=Panicum hallii TaxID=206008 RepID=UPI000DF4EE91|nr:wall-associated receptor kinase-like 17 [Panicum hallii]